MNTEKRDDQADRDRAERGTIRQTETQLTQSRETIRRTETQLTQSRERDLALLQQSDNRPTHQPITLVL